MNTCANDSIPLKRRGGYCSAQAPRGLLLRSSAAGAQLLLLRCAGLPEAGMRAKGEPQAATSKTQDKKRQTEDTKKRWWKMLFFFLFCS